MRVKHKQTGFTIVELLIVIVVIGILAAITIVAYGGIQQRATAASLQSDLSNASTQLKLEQVVNSGFPSTINCSLPDSSTNKCIKFSSGSVMAYQNNNSSTPQSFCISASKSGISYRVTNESTPVAGDCLGLYATGGTVTDAGGYRIHTFTNSGTFTVNSGINNVDVLIVAGGGGGGVDRAGAGGAGGLIYNSSFSVSPRGYSVTVGSGGTGAPANVVAGSGSNSTFSNLTALGGGGGGTGSGSIGANGGSGGGGGNSSAINPCAGGNGTVGQGNNGGLGVYQGPNYGGGGGGGAGGAGGAGTSTSSGNGGAGLAYSISGSLVYYAGGGGAGSYGGGISGLGGLGGGGNGGQSSATAGAPNTGGGGGSSGNTIINGGSGGSGIVIIRYLLP